MSEALVIEAILRSSGTSWFAAATSSWIARADWTASTTLGNSARMLSPAVLAMRPPCHSIYRSVMSWREVSRRKVPRSSAFLSRVYLATSAQKIAARRR